MYKRLLTVLLPVITMIGPPVLFTTWSKVKMALPTASIPAEQGAEQGQGINPIAAPGTASSQPVLPGMSAPRSALPIADMAEVFRFDVTPGWVVDRWPTVSVGLSQLPLQGYRVPLVTGGREDDLAGALTYYFNSRQQLERITFQGTTGDAGRLLQLLAARFRFGRRFTNDPGIFQFEVPEPGGSPKSVLHLRMVRPNEPARRFDVTLSIERPTA